MCHIMTPGHKNIQSSQRIISGGLSVATEGVTMITVVVYIECQSKTGHCNGYGTS